LARDNTYERISSRKISGERATVMEIVRIKSRYSYMDISKRREMISDRSVISTAPATDRADYFYTGNGHYWLESAGGVEKDTIIVTEEHLYEPLWSKTPNPPDLRGCIDDIRRCVLEGNPEKADEYIDRAQRMAGYDKLMNMDSKIVYPIGSPRVHKAFSFDVTREGLDTDSVYNYIRWLDMETGLITNHFEIAGESYESRIAASFADNFSAFEFTAPRGKLNISLEIKLPGGPNLFGIPTMVGSSHRWTVKENRLILSWQYNPELTSKGYYAIIDASCEDGELCVSCEKIETKNSTRLYITVKVIKVEDNFDFDGYKVFESEFDKTDKRLGRLLQGNAAILGEKMNRSYITLGKKEDCLLSGEELLEKCHSEKELYPMMMDKLYDMGRFYQIVDTGDIPPMWGQHNINTNLQVCAGNNTGLFDEMDVYFKYYESKFDDFRTNARLLFNARGLLASVHCDPDSGLLYHFSKTYPHYCWTGCLGWIYNEFWGYYLVTGDKNFLENRIIPALKEIALFFEDYACLKDEKGKSIFVPSFSPEDPTPNPDYSTVTCKDIHPTRINSVMDIAICREVLTNLIEGCKILGIEEENIPKWKRQLEELPVYLTDEEGGLKEWAWESIEENYNHRHVSHHYDIWPGRAVSVDREPELARAIKISNRKRAQQDDSAHGIIHRAFCALRLKDKEEFIQNMSQLINHGFVRRNLATAHFPYRGQFPDLQGAMPALLIEMCIYSEPGFVEFLPALPDDFAEGRLVGVWLYTFAKLESMEWSEKEIKVSITSNRDQTITFMLRNRAAKFFVNGKEYYPCDGKIDYHFSEGEKADIYIEL